MNQLTELLEVFDELPPDADVTIRRLAHGKGWICKIVSSDSQCIGIGRNQDFKKAIALALVEFHQQVYAVQYPRI